MQLKVEFSVKAEKSFDKIITYIEAKWNQKVVEKFLLKFEKSVSAIVSNPEGFTNSDFINVRKCVITKQTTIYYRFNSEKITIISIFDTRQNPNKIKKDIK